MKQNLIPFLFPYFYLRFDKIQIQNISNSKIAFFIYVESFSTYVPSFPQIHLRVFKLLENCLSMTKQAWYYLCMTSILGCAYIAKWVLDSAVSCKNGVLLYYKKIPRAHDTFRQTQSLFVTQSYHSHNFPWSYLWLIF